MVRAKNLILNFIVRLEMFYLILSDYYDKQPSFYIDGRFVVSD